MNMYRRTYVKNWEHMKPEELHEVTVKKNGEIVKEIDSKKVAYIIEDIAYWRKANAIHNWIVENCADGEDKCQEIYLRQEDLKKLLTLVNTVLASTKLVKGKVKNGTSYSKDKKTGEMKKVENIEDGKVLADDTMAKLLLPTAEGFFFGNTDYNEWYWEDLEYTKKVLESLDLEFGRCDYYYRASW